MSCSRFSTRIADEAVHQPYPAGQKGGTLIAEDVHDLVTHERRLDVPDAYRPSACPACGATVHVHDRRARVLPGVPHGTHLLRFRCADRKRCGATWQIVPVFLARWLRATWARVSEALAAGAVSGVPDRTRRRWRARLTSSARDLVAVLGTAVDGVHARVAMAAALDARRHEVVQHYIAMRCWPAARMPDPLADLAAVLHRLAPGVRLM